jgi:type II secretory pathway pseudopilin PulG
MSTLRDEIDSMNKVGAEAGFTLVEIIMIVVLLAVIAGLAIPKYIDLRKEARDETVRQIAVAISTGAEICYQDRAVKGFVPLAYPDATAIQNCLNVSNPKLDWNEVGSCATADVGGIGYAWFYDQSDASVTIQEGKGACKSIK